jgi:hypothetical protein
MTSFSMTCLSPGGSCLAAVLTGMGLRQARLTVPNKESPLAIPDHRTYFQQIIRKVPVPFLKTRLLLDGNAAIFSLAH